ncbi:50S ribosomal protein L30 [Acidipropionibacterium timonense]|uniref:50S ribosomal protein L30 n=1 Tax=Acidipropionibacterium timonense TaxID=2161818 RepID=UPI001031A9F1|nr:50S ribosomal protein L30 [Acidipropionibacterium timonense]
MSKIKVTLHKSGVNAKPKHRETLRTLGLRRPGDSVVKEDRPEIRGMANAVRHLVTMEEVD